eukprot:2021334-Ditylum_brightwellii.AAC.1
MMKMMKMTMRRKMKAKMTMAIIPTTTIKKTIITNSQNQNQHLSIQYNQKKLEEQTAKIEKEMLAEKPWQMT